VNTCKYEHGYQEEEQFKIEVFTWLYRVLNALSTDILELGYKMSHIRLVIAGSDAELPDSWYCIDRAVDKNVRSV